MERLNPFIVHFAKQTEYYGFPVSESRYAGIEPASRRN